MSALLGKGGAEIYEVFYLTPELSFVSTANMNKPENILVLKGGRKREVGEDPGMEGDCATPVSEDREMCCAGLGSEVN